MRLPCPRLRAAGRLALACGLLLLVAGSAAAEPRQAALDGMAEAAAAWFAGDFAGIETLADEAMGTAPDAGDGRTDALLAVSFGATLAEVFDVGVSLAEAVPPGDGGAPLAFVRTFNAASRGAPLAALAIAEPVLADGAEPSAWRDLLAGAAGMAASAVARHAEAIRLTGDARRALAARLGAEHPLATLARLWHIGALAAGSAPELDGELDGLFALLATRPGELPVIGLIAFHAAIGIAPAGEIAAMAGTAFDGAMRRLPADSVLVGLALEDLAYAAAVAGDYRRELQVLARAGQIYGARLAGDAPALGSVAMGMAMASANLGMRDEAVRLADAALEMTRSGTGGTSPMTAGRFAEAATVNLLAGDVDRALALVRNARRLFGIAGAGDWAAARLFIPLQEAKILMAAGRPDEAAAVQGAVLADLAATWAGSLAEAVVMGERASALRAAGRTAEALATARQALKGLVHMRASRDAALGGSGGPTISHSLLLAARALVESAWQVAER